MGKAEKDIKYDNVPRKCGCVNSLERGTVVLFLYRPHSGPQVIQGVTRYSSSTLHMYDVVDMHNLRGNGTSIMCSAIYLPRPENPMWPWQVSV